MTTKTKSDLKKLEQDNGETVGIDIQNIPEESEEIPQDPTQQTTPEPNVQNSEPITGSFSLESAIEDGQRQSDIMYKVIIIGNSGVGKTNLLGRWMSDRFEIKSTTINADVAFKTFEVNGKVIKVQFWDTAGTEAHFSLTQSYFRKSHGAIIVYDVTQAGTFFDVQKWVHAVRDVSGNENTHLMLIGNKSDLTNREVTTAMGLEFARREQINFMETSALNGNNVHRAFQLLLQDIHKTSESVAALPALQGSIFDMITEGMSVSLDNYEQKNKMDESCCGDFNITSIFS